jgi:hypothetical protein
MYFSREMKNRKKRNTTPLLIAVVYRVHIPLHRKPHPRSHGSSFTNISGTGNLIGINSKSSACSGSGLVNKCPSCSVTRCPRLSIACCMMLAGTGYKVGCVMFVLWFMQPLIRMFLVDSWWIEHLSVAGMMMA